MMIATESALLTTLLELLSHAMESDTVTSRAE